MRRRDFLPLTALSATRILGANDRVRIGLIGCGGRGRYVAGFMRQAPGAEFTAVCDVYQPRTESARQWAGGAAKAYADFRKLLEDREVDAVLIATPDHWHAIPTILACQAGKDVYVEKPLAHNIREGRAMVNAARRYNRIVQAGTQQRSATHFPECAGIIQSGRLGRVTLVRVWNYSNMLPKGIGLATPGAPKPEGLDWDLFCGPAPLRPFNEKRFQQYRWFWDYAGGTITDYGTHRFDTVHQIMGVDRPLRVSASGGRFALNDEGEMPDTMQVTYEYPGFVLSYEMSNISAHGVGGRTDGMKYYQMKGAEDRPHGMAFYGTNGALFADRVGFEIYPDNDNIVRRKENPPNAIAEQVAAHTRNFVQCIRDRKTPNADVEIGHRSTIVPHLGNIAYKTGAKLRWDAAAEDFRDAPAEASLLLGRAARRPWDWVG